MQSIVTIMNTAFRTALLITGCILCFASVRAQIPDKGLKDYYNDYFPVGVAVSPRSLQSTDEVPLILAQFNSLTAENAMKMGPIHPEEGRFNWKDGDSIAAFAQRYHLKMRGHVLCWHEQTPDWLFKDAEGQPVTKEVLLKRLETHITAIVQYKMIFKVLRDFKKEITGVTFWNISDRHTWLDFYPVRGRKNYPLLFDQNLQPKKVYWEVVKF